MMSSVIISLKGNIQGSFPSVGCARFECQNSLEKEFCNNKNNVIQNSHYLTLHKYLHILNAHI